MNTLHELVADAARTTSEVVYDAPASMLLALDRADLAAAGDPGVQIRSETLNNDGAGCHAGKDEMRRAAQAARWSDTPPIIRLAHTIGRRACARPSGRYVLGSVCAGLEQSSRAQRVVFMA
jgi:hypothetical protein